MLYHIYCLTGYVFSKNSFLLTIENDFKLKNRKLL